ncbi:MAG: cation diffusion facilitator family transporter, partial [Parvibaculales bacterium]
MSHNHHHHNHLDMDAAGKVRGTALLAIFVALVMIIIKAIGWLMTGSVALLGTFLDSVMDLSISVMNFFAIQHAQTPADKEHRFGHGKAEALAALAQATLLLLAAFFLIYETVQAFVNPSPITQTNIGIGVLVVSIILTIGLVFVQRRVAKSTGSVALLADSAHYAGDIYINLGVIGALILSGYFGFIYA